MHYALLSNLEGMSQKNKQLSSSSINSALAAIRGRCLLINLPKHQIAHLYCVAAGGEQAREFLPRLRRPRHCPHALRRRLLLLLQGNTRLDWSLHRFLISTGILPAGDPDWEGQEVPVQGGEAVQRHLHQPARLPVLQVGLARSAAAKSVQPLAPAFSKFILWKWCLIFFGCS